MKSRKSGVTKILAFDTSSDYLSIALARADGTVASFHRRVERDHSRLLAPEIERICRRSGVALAGLDAIAVGVGPGSFTGLRIGVATTKAMGYALGVPLIGIPTLDVIAQNAAEHRGTVVVVLDARKNKVYACIYRSDGTRAEKVSDHLLVTQEELGGLLKAHADVVIIGDRAAGGFGGYEICKEPWQPRAVSMLPIASGCYARQMFASAEKLEPLYLYSKECDITGR